MGVVYNNTYRSLHYIRRNLSVCPHQAACFVKTFDILTRNNLILFFNDIYAVGLHLHVTFLSAKFSYLMRFAKHHFSLNIYVMHLYENDRMQ